MPSKDTLFRSWKAIANHFGCSERTVRRWEAREGLPVHRHHHVSGARIFAYQAELDEWFAHRSGTQTSAPVQKPVKPRVALLPFDFFSQDPAVTFIRDAFCEDVVANLSCLTSIAVLSYSSTRLLPEKSDNREQRLSILQADLYVEGSIRVVADHGKINVRLIKGTEGVVIWSASYCQTQPDWEYLRQKLVSELIGNLPLSQGEAQDFPAQQALLNNQTAWEYLHQARYHSLKWQPDAINRALELLRAANQLVGPNSMILAHLGRVYLQQRESGIDCTETPVAQVRSILKQLNQTHPDAFYTLSLSAWYDYLIGNIPSAINSLKRAIALQPNDADCLALVANCYLVSGQADLAWPYIKELQIVDPLTPLSHCMPGYYNLMAGNFSAAVGPYQEMLAMDPANPIYRMFLVWVLALNNDSAGTAVVCKGFAQLPTSPVTSLVKNISLALSDGIAGRSCQLELSGAQLEVLAVNGMLARFTAFGFAATGEQQAATHWLRQAFELGFWAYPFMKYHDRFFSQFGGYPPLKRLMADMENKWRRQLKP